MKPNDTILANRTGRVTVPVRTTEVDAEKPAGRTLSLQQLKSLVDAAPSEEPTVANANVTQLKQALGRIEHLSGLLYLCVYCKRVGDCSQDWVRVEWPFGGLESRLNHTICPNCYETVVMGEVAQVYAYMRRRGAGNGHRNGREASNA